MQYLLYGIGMMLAASIDQSVLDIPGWIFLGTGVASLIIGLFSYQSRKEE
jgi:hypothetical protein